MNNEVSIIDNLLDKEIFKNIQNNMLGNWFPWYYSSNVAFDDETDPYFYFQHLLYSDDKVNSDFFWELEPLFEKISITKIIRIKANLYTKVFHEAMNDNHVDFNFDHKGAIFYINTNNGKTIIEDTHIIDSVENRLLLFNPSLLHRSTHPTDSKIRVNISINFL